MRLLFRNWDHAAFKAWMDSYKITTMDLAKCIGVERQSVSDWRNGHFAPKNINLDIALWELNNRLKKMPVKDALNETRAFLEGKRSEEILQHKA